MTTILKSHIKKAWFFSSLFISLILLFYLANLKGGHGWDGDFSMYIMNAQNILSGAPYAQTKYLYNVDTSYYGPKAYPPIFPLMLVPVLAVWGVNLKALKIVGIVCFGLLLFYLNRRILPEDFPPLSRLLYILIIGFYPLFFIQADSIYSDFPFLLFSTIALKRINDQLKPSQERESQWFQACLTGLIIYLAYGTRTVGISLLPVVLVLDLWRNKRISVSTVLTLGTTIFLIVLQSMMIPEIGSYLDQLPKSFQEVFFQVIKSLLYYFTMFVNIFWFDNYVLMDIVFLVFFEFSLIGLFTRLKRGITSIELFCLFYLGVLCIWPSYQSVRFLYPIIPFYVLFSLEGFQRIVEKLNKLSWLSKTLPVLLLFCVTFYYSTVYVGLVPRGISELEKSETQELFQFVRSKTGPDDVIAFFKPRVLALFTDRTSVAVAVPPPGGDTLGRMQALGVNYVIVRVNYPVEYQLEYQQQMIQFISENPADFDLVYANPEFRMYAFIPR